MLSYKAKTPTGEAKPHIIKFTCFELLMMYSKYECKNRTTLIHNNIGTY